MAEGKDCSCKAHAGDNLAHADPRGGVPHSEQGSHAEKVYEYASHSNIVLIWNIKLARIHGRIRYDFIWEIQTISAFVTFGMMGVVA